jgi:hypothetical protein
MASTLVIVIVASDAAPPASTGPVAVTLNGTLVLASCAHAPSAHRLTMSIAVQRRRDGIRSSGSLEEIV